MLKINKISFLYLIIFICLILLVLSIFFPKILSWLVVLIFVSLTTKLCFDGIQMRRNLLDNRQLNQIIANLESRSDTVLTNFSRNQLYKINKTSLLDKIYRDNPELQNWEKNQRYYQNLPNLLLAFGLLGTFVGITINLFLLSRNTGGEIPLDKTLEDIIGSMAISFISSLGALVSSVILTKFYPAYDLELQKNHIFNQLEYYIENECNILLNLPSIEEKIDDLIQSLVNLPQSIKNLEKSVSLSSQNLITSVNIFEKKINNAGNTIDNAGNTIENAADILNKATSNLANITQNFSDFISTLETSATSLDSTTTSLETYTEHLQKVINDLNNNSSNIQKLITSNHNELSNISLRLEENGKSLLSSIQTFNINASQVEKGLNNHTRQVGTHNSHLQNLSTQFVNHSQILQSIQQKLQDILDDLKGNN